MVSPKKKKGGSPGRRSTPRKTVASPGRKSTTTTKKGGKKIIRSPLSSQRKKDNDDNKVKYYSRDFITHKEVAITSGTVTASHVHMHINKNKEKLSLNGVIADVTEEQKEECAKHMRTLRTTILRFATKRIEEMAVEYSNNVLQYKREDGQEVSESKDVVAAAKRCHRKGVDDDNFKLLYEECFVDGWEFSSEAKCLHDYKIIYRQWTEKQKAPKGFVAKLHTLALNKYRRKYNWIKKKVKDEDDTENASIQEKQRKGPIKFDPKKHVRDLKKNKPTKRNITQSVDVNTPPKKTKYDM